MAISLTVNQLGYERNAQVIIANINFNLQAGEILQVTGGNGSGKTTLLRLLAGLIQPTVGELTWCGQPFSIDRIAYQQALFYVGHKAGVKTELSAYENLHLMTGLVKTHPAVSLRKALAQVELENYADSYAYQLSAGQQRRLVLAKLLMVSAKLWILDEPFTALDTRGIQLFETFISQHLQAGGMVILTSHQRYQLTDIVQKQLLL